MFLHSCCSCIFFGFSLGSSIMGSWVIIFTIVILGVKVSSNSLSYSDEVVNIDEVGDVCVEVVLEMLHHVQVRLNVFVSSNSWEWEGTIHKFPCVNSWYGGFHFFGNLKSVQVVLFIKVSWEHIHLPVEFFFADPKFWLAWSISWGKSIDNGIITGVLKLNSLSGEDSEEHKISEFHFIKNIIN